MHPPHKCCTYNIEVTCKLPAHLLTFYKKICEISQKNRENPSRFTLGAGVKVTSKLLILHDNEVRITVCIPSAGHCINMQKRPSTMNKYAYWYSVHGFEGQKDSRLPVAKERCARLRCATASGRKRPRLPAAKGHGFRP